MYAYSETTQKLQPQRQNSPSQVALHNRGAFLGLVGEPRSGSTNMAPPDGTTRPLVLPPGGT